MNLRLAKLADLKPDPNNAREHGDENLEAIEKSLRNFQQVEPLVVQKSTGVVIGGNGRLAVMTKMGLEECWVVDVDLDDQKARALGIALNRTGELAEWNQQRLADLLASLPQDVRCDVGFSDADYLAMVAKFTTGETDPDDVPEPPDAATTLPGDIWVLGNHRLLCGDSSKHADLDRLLSGARIHVANTDPPYNVKIEPRSDRAIAAGNKGMPGGTQYDKIRAGTLSKEKLRPKDRHLQNDFENDGDFDAMMRGVISNIARALLPGRAFYVWCGAFPSNNGGPANTETFPQMFREVNLRYAQMIVWNKGHGILGRKDFMTQYEVCLYGWMGGAGHEWFGPNNATDLWDVKRVTGQNMVHLTEKPVELARRAIEYSSKPGENVLDLFGGSGSTLIGAEMTGRHAFLMELDTLYCDVIVQRWEKFTGKKATLDGDGRTFEQVRQERAPAAPAATPEPAEEKPPVADVAKRGARTKKVKNEAAV